MATLQDVIEELVRFRDERDWKQFHNPKDVALSMVLEAGEVVEHFQWRSPEEIEKYVISNKEEIGEEIADVLYWVLLLSNDLDIDVVKSLEKKMKKTF